MKFENTQNNLILEQEQNNYELENTESELHFNNEEPQATFEEVSNELGFDAPRTMGGGTNDHNELTNRDIENQHPIGAITGLEEALKNAGNIKDVQVNDKSVVDTNGVADINVPRDLGELTNNAGYVHKSSTNLEHYYTKTETDKKINALSLGTVINIEDTFYFGKTFANNDVYNANAVNSSVDWIIQAILEAFNREVIVNINVVVNPQTFQIISIDGSYFEVVNAVDLGGIPRVVCQMAGTNIKVFLNLAMINGTYAFFTTTMKVDLGAGETKYLLGVNISERNQYVIIEPLA